MRIVDNEITFKELIDYFADCVTRSEDDAAKYIHGEVPQHPPLVFLLGDDERSFVGIANNLFGLWPQYKNKLRFVGASICDGEVCHRWLRFDAGGSVVSVGIDQGQLAEVFEELFADADPFAKMAMAHVYYIVDTTSIDTFEAFESLMQLIPLYKRTFDDCGFRLRDSLVVLLKSDMRRRPVARRIRAYLAGFETGDCGIDCNSVLVLSSHRNDGVLLRSWSKCYRIASLFMALSNSKNETTNSMLFQRRVLTASYAAVKKPVHAIGQVVVDDILRKLDTCVNVIPYDLFEEDEIDAKLGVTRDGTFEVIDAGADLSLRHIVPTEDELALFPRNRISGVDVSRITYRDFDALSMGALSTYLEQRRKRLLVEDERQRRRWKDSYGTLLRRNFSIDELIYLGAHLEDVRNRLASPDSREVIGGVRAGAFDKLKITMARDPQVIDLFVEQVRCEAKRAGDFRSMWRRLLDSLLDVPDVDDEALKEFYQQRADAFIDELQYGNDLGRQFSSQPNVDALRTFLYGVVDRLIDSDKVFTDSFEKELQKRLDSAEEGADVNNWIYQHLTRENLHTYLQVNFALGAPIAKAVFLEGESELKTRLCAFMPVDTQFYHTGNNRFVEALNIYAVDGENLNQTSGR